MAVPCVCQDYDFKNFSAELHWGYRQKICKKGMTLCVIINQKQLFLGAKKPAVAGSSWDWLWPFGYLPGVRNLRHENGDKSQKKHQHAADKRKNERC